MTHVFDPSQKHKLESDSRKNFLPKEPVIDFISSLAPEDRKTALEIGSGTGYFTVILTEYFQKVYGTEISLDMANYLQKRLEDEGIKNVGIIVAEKPQIDFKVDLLFLANVLHEVGEPLTYLSYPAKRVVVVDWKKEEASFGPPSSIRIPEEKVVEMLESKSYETTKFDVYQHHYFIVGRKEEEVNGGAKDK